ncbi:Uncharacterised protein [uncultured archaeon]|nr:Uncharacterised protein [uncultured archaeon]
MKPSYLRIMARIKHTLRKRGLPHRAAVLALSRGRKKLVHLAPKDAPNFFSEIDALMSRKTVEFDKMRVLYEKAPLGLRHYAGERMIKQIQERISQLESVETYTVGHLVELVEAHARLAEMERLVRVAKEKLKVRH